MKRARLAPASVAAAAVVAALTLSACGGSDEPDVDLSSVAAASSAPDSGALVPAQEFAAAMQVPGTVLIDVRTPEEFDQGHLEGARLINLQADDFARQIEALDPSMTYAVYCRSANRSAVAVQQMTALGLDAYHLDGGIQAWADAGGPVVTD